jgi:putative chitinase
MIVETGSSLDMDDYEIAYALATARFESGFNPDAAAKTTSAKGVGQFVNKTGEAYGLTDDNQWDASAQVQALLEHTRDNFEMARKKGYSNEYVYALHHDGPSLDRGGLSLSKKNVMPFVPKYLAMIRKYRGEE